MIAYNLQEAIGVFDLTPLRVRLCVTTMWSEMIIPLAKWKPSLSKAAE